MAMDSWNPDTWCCICFQFRARAFQILICLLLIVSGTICCSAFLSVFQIKQILWLKEESFSGVCKKYPLARSGKGSCAFSLRAPSLPETLQGMWLSVMPDPLLHPKSASCRQESISSWFLLAHERWWQPAPVPVPGQDQELTEWIKAACESWAALVCGWITVLAVRRVKMCTNWGLREKERSRTEGCWQCVLNVPCTSSIVSWWHMCEVVKEPLTFLYTWSCEKKDWDRASGVNQGGDPKLLLQLFPVELCLTCQ